jgi:hypothetical protein
MVAESERSSSAMSGPRKPIGFLALLRPQLQEMIPLPKMHWVRAGSPRGVTEFSEGANVEPCQPGSTGGRARAGGMAERAQRRDDPQLGAAPPPECRAPARHAPSAAEGNRREHRGVTRPTPST